jgi:hypothetical protein
MVVKNRDTGGEILLPWLLGINNAGILIFPVKATKTINDA